jgi:peroxiredoxin Q/BCP
MLYFISNRNIPKTIFILLILADQIHIKMSELIEGQKAPAFTAKDQNGKLISLSNYTGKNIVLYFYPKDDTPGCTAEACNFRDNYESLLAQGFVVLGVSTDDEKSHLKFINKHNLPFSLIADTEKEIVEAYGVWVEKNMYGKKYMGIARKTFIIDEKGNILKIIDKVDTKNSSAQVLDLLN